MSAFSQVWLRVYSLLHRLLGGFRFQHGLGGGEAGDRDAERRTAHVGQPELVAELHGWVQARLLATVSAADAQLEVRALAVAYFYRLQLPATRRQLVTGWVQ